VGSDIGVVAYDGASYVYIIGSGTNAVISAANDRVQPNIADTDVLVRIKNAAVRTDGNSIVSMSQFSNTNDRTANPAIRMKTDNTANCYVLYMNRLSGQANLYRVDAGSFVLLASPARAIGAGHTVTFKAVTNGAQVDLTGTISGLSDVTFSDTNANRKLDGTPGFHLFNTGSTMSSWLDNLSADDVTVAAAKMPKPNLQAVKRAGYF
jgi:hypothetical protein